jgi:long-chain acyl-CoA synthetase
VKRAADASSRGMLEESLATHLALVNETLDPHEQLDCLVVVREAWTVDNDLVTPTLKVKRNRIEAVYSRHYESWVGSRRPVVWH